MSIILPFAPFSKVGVSRIKAERQLQIRTGASPLATRGNDGARAMGRQRPLEEVLRNAHPEGQTQPQNERGECHLG